MGVSLYYKAERPTPLTKEEEQAIQQVINNYQRSFGFKEEGEDFCVYEPDNSEPMTIFVGATGLPMGDLEDMHDACLHWAACLTEVRHILNDCEWSVHLDDHDLLWCEETGWYLSDEF
ncbi:hypothetical protein [Paenibacillus sp. L3-i20]|uniref:hypothetical protein n=1 Tax=Paenibacillus sp. L3-i20 TaxID=2905833 RepID=UPI001EE02E24|nr:hypothetical protein [Paenibacillus sp. L3-i20]GKU78143.1 hypothetical protein L3i20_v225400 [Paenibacillus sp. L3-i20]